MALKEKLDLLSLSDDERTKAEAKFLATLSLVDEDEIREIISYLSTQGVQISKAREIKVLGDSKVEIAKKFSILGEIHEEGIYREDPTLIPRNALDIYKKIMYCIQSGRAYKKEDGTYEDFLFSEAAWQKAFNKDSAMVSDLASQQVLEESFVTVEPVIEQPEETIAPIIEEEKVVSDPLHMDIQEYMAASKDESLKEPEIISFASLKNSVEKMQEELGDIDSQTVSLASQRQALEQEYQRLSDFKDTFANALDDEFIGFGEIEPESYGMGRAA